MHYVRGTRHEERGSGTRIETHEVLLRPVKVSTQRFEPVPGPIMDKGLGLKAARSTLFESAEPEFITARPAGLSRGHTAFLTVAQAPPSLDGVDLPLAAIKS